VLYVDHVIRVKTWHDFVFLIAGYNFLGSTLVVETSVAGGAKKR